MLLGLSLSLALIPGITDLSSDHTYMYTPNTAKLTTTAVRIDTCMRSATEAVGGGVGTQQLRSLHAYQLHGLQ